MFNAWFVEFDPCVFSRSDPVFFLKMPGLITGKKRCTPAPVSFTNSFQPSNEKTIASTSSRLCHDVDYPILPGLPDDVAMICLALVPRSDLPNAAAVCKKWRSLIRTKEFLVTRKLAGMLEEWIYFLITEDGGKESHWEVLDSHGNKQRLPPPMLSPAKVGFGVVTLDGKLFIIGGYYLENGTGYVSSEVYQYDAGVNSWTQLANMNEARRDFACTEVNGMIYVVGGSGIEGESLSSAEAYCPETNEWTKMEPPRRPRRGSFGFSFEENLYIMGGRSSFSIGNSRFVDIYDSRSHQWLEMKNGCVMVTSQAVIGRKLYCVEWKNQRKLAVFDCMDRTWSRSVPIPLTGSLNIEFRFGIVDGKLLLFSHKKAPWYATLVYDPEADPGSEWRSCKIKPSGECLLSVTLEA